MPRYTHPLHTYNKLTISIVFQYSSYLIDAINIILFLSLNNHSILIRITQTKLRSQTTKSSKSRFNKK